MSDLDNTDLSVMPSYEQLLHAHAMWGDWMVARGQMTRERANAIISMFNSAPHGTTPFFGLIVAAQLIMAGAVPAKTPPSRAAVWMATALYNAEFDIHRRPMRSNELPDDAIVNPSEPFIQALVQDLMSTGAAPPSTAFSEAAYNAALSDATAAIARLKK